MKGYLRGAAASENPAHRDGWLGTGDVGYLADGELYVVGRTKDVIKKAGSRYDAADIQALVSEVPGVRAGRVAAFGIENAERGVEELVIVAETRLSAADELDALANALRRTVTRTFATGIDVICLVPPNELARTSSGKVRVQACRQKYLERGLQSVLLARGAGGPG